MRPPEPPYTRETVEYAALSQQPDGSWEQATGYSTDIDYARERRAARQAWGDDLELDVTFRLAKRTTTVTVEFVPEA